jgi:hypothetical protein
LDDGVGDIIGSELIFFGGKDDEEEEDDDDDDEEELGKVTFRVKVGVFV